jgi:hypothetical protein
MDDEPLSPVCDCLFSILQLASISGSVFLHPQSEDMPCHGIVNLQVLKMCGVLNRPTSLFHLL